MKRKPGRPLGSKNKVKEEKLKSITDESSKTNTEFIDNDATGGFDITMK